MYSLSITLNTNTNTNITNNNNIIGVASFLSMHSIWNTKVTQNGRLTVINLHYFNYNI